MAKKRKARKSLSFMAQTLLNTASKSLLSEAIDFPLYGIKPELSIADVDTCPADFPIELVDLIANISLLLNISGVFEVVVKPVDRRFFGRDAVSEGVHPTSFFVCFPSDTISLKK